MMETPDNRLPDSGLPYFEEPMIGFATAKDSIFIKFKKIIGEFHFTPAKIMESPMVPLNEMLGLSSADASHLQHNPWKQEEGRENAVTWLGFDTEPW